MSTISRYAKGAEIPRVREPYPCRKQTPYTSPKTGRTPTTAVIGFPYREGVLVCADTQMSYPTGLKYQDTKVFAGDFDGSRCIFAFADESGLASEIRTTLFKRIQKQANLTTDQFLETAKATMKEYGRFQNQLPLEFLLAVYPVSEQPAIIHFDGKSINTKTDEPVILGCGNDSLTRYLAENLFLADLDWYPALAFGCYVIKKATQYIQGCGEPIEAIRLTQNAVQEMDAENVQWACNATEQQEAQMQKWLFKRI